MARKKKKQQEPWQYQFSFVLVGLSCLLIFGFFVQSLDTVREAKPIHIAVDRIKSD
jgi:hypothetical protein